MRSDKEYDLLVNSRAFCSNSSSMELILSTKLNRNNTSAKTESSNLYKHTDYALLDVDLN